MAVVMASPYMVVDIEQEHVGELELCYILA